jgi:hypothetical protein
MSYHTNAILDPLPRLGRRSVGMAGFGALGLLGLGAVPNITLVGNIAAVARKFPNAKDGEVIYLAVAGTPGLTPAEIQAITPTLLTKLVGIARANPTWSAQQVFQGTLVKLKEPSMADRVAVMTKRAGPTAGAFLKACMLDPVGKRDTNECYSLAEKQVGTLQGDQTLFYNNCLSQKATDVPVVVQHNACFSEAKKLSSGPGPAPTVTAPFTPPPEVTPASVDEGGGLMSNKWVWLGGAVAVAGLAYVLLKKPAPAHA